MPPKSSYEARGKVLLSGEYLVLDGALALGIPLNLGQRMTVTEGSGLDIIWQSYQPDGNMWFKGKFDLFGFEAEKTTDKKIADTLSTILEAAVRLNSDFLSKWKKYRVNTYLDFDPEWGLGSSSTLISCVAEWADVDPFDLLEATFGGSGYDIACAKADGPIFFQSDNENYSVDPADFFPAFEDQLYLVYTGKKQNTQKEIANYKSKRINGREVDEISQISRSLCTVNELKYFEELLQDHENLISEVIGQPRVKKQVFEDYWGEVKSLGAWGGDFVIATSDRSPKQTQEYFNQKGFDVFFGYKDLAIDKSTVGQRV